jgi:hypothetical protein
MQGHVILTGSAGPHRDSALTATAQVIPQLLLVIARRPLVVRQLDLDHIENAMIRNMIASASNTTITISSSAGARISQISLIASATMQ